VESPVGLAFWAHQLLAPGSGDRAQPESYVTTITK
jgi:hypothetical protein